MSRNLKTLINVFSSVAVLMTNILISFYLSPYIVASIGVEANGFITLANNFVSYISLLVIALNSMSARFITVAYVQKDYKKANLYYNSVFWGKIILVILLLLPTTYFIIQLQTFVNIPPRIMLDVKMLFAFVFMNFFIMTGAPNWEAGTYITNRLDRQYIPVMIITLIRCFLIVALFYLFIPKVWYIGFVTTIATIVGLLVNAYNTHKLTPELNVKFKKKERLYSFKVLKELLGAGIWNSISNVGNMLLSGLDLLICNITLGATAMGILALSKLFPNYMQQLSASIRNAFAPELTINFANNNKTAVLSDLNRAMKLTAIILTIPIAGILVFGDAFFALWVPSQDAKLLQILSILSILGYMFTSGTQILYNVFTTVNKVKTNAIAMIISGICSVIITLFLINFTQLGLYAVAGVSTFVNFTRNMLFTLPITAKYLGYKRSQFYPQVISTAISSIILIILGLAIRVLLPVGSWLELLIAAAVLGATGLILNFIIILNKREKLYLVAIVKRKLKR